MELHINKDERECLQLILILDMSSADDSTYGYSSLVGLIDDFALKTNEHLWTVLQRHAGEAGDRETELLQLLAEVQCLLQYLQEKNVTYQAQ